MIKPDSLRAALTAVLPHLATDPDRLALFIDEGKIHGSMRAAPGFPDPGFEYRYTLNAVLLDFTDHPDTVMTAIMLWLHEHQPDLLQRPHEPPFTFQADVIDAKTIDLAIAIQLTETVRAVPRDEGGHELQHLPEPPAIDELEGVERWTPLRQIYLGDRLIAGEADE